MECPKCQFDHEDQTTECLRCGIVFAKYAARQQDIPTAPLRNTVPMEVEDDEEPQTASEALFELKCRFFALPVALLTAAIAVATSGGAFIRIFFGMWVHEAGHAVTAWLCGFGALPGPWFTQVSDSRALAVVAVVTAGLGYGIFVTWRARRWALVAGCATALMVQLVCTTLPVRDANALVIFGGDAGSMVLGSLLMATFYARRDSQLYRGALRWGFLMIGAAAFADAFHTWWGARSDASLIPFGENVGMALSDPTRLMDEYGWGMQSMIDRYVWLGVACLAAMTALYVVGIVQARKALRARKRSALTAGI